MFMVCNVELAVKYAYSAQKRLLLKVECTHIKITHHTAIYMQCQPNCSNALLGTLEEWKLGFIESDSRE
jgi:hypothetical protein